jgi:hypothetical protein
MLTGRPLLIDLGGQQIFPIQSTGLTLSNRESRRNTFCNSSENARAISGRHNSLTNFLRLNLLIIRPIKTTWNDLGRTVSLGKIRHRPNRIELRL